MHADAMPAADRTLLAAPQAVAAALLRDLERVRNGERWMVKR
jgi:hypothetical protein